MCSEMGHRMADCPKRNRTTAAVDTTPEEEAEALGAKQLVSVAFMNNRGKCNHVTNCVSLFDSGSLNSFVRLSDVPFLKNLS